MFNDEELRGVDGNNIPIERVFFRVLDLRVRRQMLNVERMRPYCVVRLGELHHRTCSFSPEGLDQVSARRTTTDDRQSRACEVSNAEGNPGVWWHVPTSWIDQHCGEAPLYQGVESRTTEEEGHWTQMDQGQLHPSGSGLGDDDSDLMLEIFNASIPNTGLSIDGFDAELVGVLRIKLSDVWPRASATQYRARVDKREVCDEIRSGSDRTPSGDDRSIRAAPPPDRTCNDQNQSEDSHRRRLDRWFGGVVSSSCSSPRSLRTRAANDTNTFSVEARLEIIWSRTEKGRSTALFHDDFGLTVDPRNAIKCSSAQGLWCLQQPSRRKRWMSEEGQKWWSSFLDNCKSVDPAPGSMSHWGSELRELVWSGVPTEMREEVYLSLSGAAWKRERFKPGYYTSLVSHCRKLEGKENREGRREQDRETDIIGFPGEPKLECSTADVGDMSGSGLDYCRAERSASRAQAQYTEVDSKATSGRPSLHAGETSGAQGHLQVWSEIEADLGRVFTNGRTRVNESSGISALRRLLRAYSLHNPAVGYCQGMNFIAGLLLEVMSEETTFWLLDVFCETLHPGYHTKNMLGARSDIAALKDLIRRVLPRLHAEADDVYVPLEIKLTQWLVVGFVNCFPPSTALRILEVAFLEGSDVYLATVLAFLRLHEVEILSGEDMTEVVRTLDLAQAGMYETDILLLQVWREFALWRHEIRSARLWHRERLIQDNACIERRSRAGDDRPTDYRSGWLQGRISVGSGPPGWLFLVPKPLTGQVEEILSSLSKRAFAINQDVASDGKMVARPSLVPLLMGGIRWLLGWKLFET